MDYVLSMARSACTLSSPMLRAAVCFCLFIGMAAPLVADEQVRQVQEELRKRNLYFGEVDGRSTAELTAALRKYQARKGFEVTGAVDAETATSLHVQSAAATAEKQPSTWPEMPVLRSDAARAVPAAERVALERAAEQNPDLVPTPPPPAESPPPSQNLTPDRVNKFVEDYLRDGETQDVALQTRFYAYPVEYFDHGMVDDAFVAKDTRNYVRRWPERKYMLLAPVNFVAAGKEGETLADFSIAFTVRNKNHVVSGKTRNFWTIRSEGDELKIVAIREQRLRE